MRAKVAHVINRACCNETPAFKKQLKRTWNKVPRPMRNKFRSDLVKSCESEVLAEQKSTEVTN